MAIGNQKLIGQLSLGLETLRTNIKDANKILEGITVKKLNLDIIDEKTKNKLIETAKAIKKEIENISKTGKDTSQTKALADGILKSFRDIEIKSKDMTKVITETFSKNAKDALDMAGQVNKATNIVSTSYDVSGKKVVESLKAIYDADKKFSGYKPTSKVTTDDASTKLDKISIAYKKLSTEQKSNESVMRGMSNEVQKVIEKYGLQGKALESATTQSAKYKGEAEKITQTQTQQSEAISTAINKTVKAREAERLAQEKAQSGAINKNLEAQYVAQVKQTAQSLKQAQATEKQGLAELKLYTQEKSQTSQYDLMSKQIAKISGEANLAMSSSNAGSSIMDRFKISGVYAMAAQSIYMLRNAVTDMIQTNRDFEVGLNNLGRILNSSSSELKAFGENAIQIAKEMGEPLAQVQSAYSSLAAAGVQNASDLNAMARTVTMGLNTSTIKDASTMTDLLTTSMKQMNIPFTESEKVLDEWNYLADKSVATTEDFAQAVSKAGLTSKSMGIDMSHLNAMVATLADSTGASGSAIGDALKSVESRLLRPETLSVLEKYGIEVMKDKDHFKDFGTIMGDVSTQLNKFGDNTVQSTEILDALGGTLRKNWVNLLAQGTPKIDTTAATVAVDSIGYSATKSTKTMETLDKKIINFNNTIKEMYIGVGDSGLSKQLKGFVEVGTVLAKVGAWAAPFLLTLGEVSAALAAINLGMKVLKGQSLTQLLDTKNLSWLQSAANFSGMKGANFNSGTTSAAMYDAAVKSLQKDILAKNITEAQSSAILTGVSQKMGMASTTTNTLAAAEGALKIQVAEGTITKEAASAEMVRLTAITKASTLANAEKTAADKALNEAQVVSTASAKGLQMAMMGVTLGITAVLMIGIPLISWLTQADERQQKLLADGAEMAKKYDDESKSLTTLISSYEDLSASGKTDNETKKQLLDIQTQLLSSFGDEAKGIDLVNGKYQDQIKILRDASVAEAKKAEAALTDKYQGAKDVLVEKGSSFGSGMSNSMFSNEAGLGTDNKMHDSLTQGINGITEKGINGTLEERISILGQILERANNNNNLTASQKQLVTDVQGEYDSLTGKLKNASDISKEWNILQLQSNSKYNTQLTQMITAKSKLETATTANDIPGIKKANADYKTLYDSMEKLLAKNPPLKKAFEDWAKGLNNTGDAATNSAADIGLTKDELVKLTTSFDTSLDSISSYNKLMADYDTNKKFSSESVKEIIDKHQELAGYLNDEPLLYKKIGEALNAEKKVANKAYGEMMANSESYYASNIAGTNIIQNALGGYYKNLTDAQKNDLNNAKTVAESKLIVEKALISRMATAWDDYNKAVGTVLNKHAELAKRAEGNAQGDEHTDALLSRLVGNNKAVQDAYTNAQSIQSQINAIDTSFDNITAKIVAPKIKDYGADTSTAKKTNETKANEAAEKAAAAKEKKEAAAQAKAEKAQAAEEKRQAAATQRQADLEAKAAEKVANDQLRVATATTDASRKAAQNTLTTDIEAEEALKKKGATAAQISEAKISAIQAETENATGIAQAATAKIVATQKAASDALIAGYQKQIDAINAKADAETRTTTQLKYQNDIINNQNDLVNAQNQKNVRIYENGKWQWEADQTAIKTAKTSLQSTQTDFSKFKTDNANTDKIASLNALIKIQQDKQAAIASSTTTTGYAEGTPSVPKTDEYLVGEKGPEKVILNKGSAVIPNNKLTAASSGVSTNKTASATNQLMASTGSTLQNFANTTAKYGKAIDSKLGQSLTSNARLVNTPVKNLLKGVDNSVQKFVDSAPEYGKDFNNNTGKAIKTNDQLVKKPVDVLVRDLGNNIQSFVNSTPAYGKGTDKNMGDAISKNSKLMTVPMDVVINQVKSGIVAFVASTYSDGTGIVDEMGKGITDKNKAIVDIVNKLTKQIIDLFNDGFGIASPSKVNNIAV